jgi:hypothetical protein
MKILVMCEESQAVCIAFLEKGHDAWSCDIQPCSGPDQIGITLVIALKFLINMGLGT